MLLCFLNIMFVKKGDWNIVFIIIWIIIKIIISQNVSTQGVLETVKLSTLIIEETQM